MNGVIYARYSSDNQREESIEGQVRECMEFAEKQGIIILSTYVDRALSAKTDKRPEFQRRSKTDADALKDRVFPLEIPRQGRRENRFPKGYKEFGFSYTMKKAL